VHYGNFFPDSPLHTMWIMSNGRRMDRCNQWNCKLSVNSIEESRQPEVLIYFLMVKYSFWRSPSIKSYYLGWPLSRQALSSRVAPARATPEAQPNPRTNTTVQRPIRPLSPPTSMVVAAPGPSKTKGKHAALWHLCERRKGTQRRGYGWQQSTVEQLCSGGSSLGRQGSRRCYLAAKAKCFWADKLRRRAGLIWARSGPETHGRACSSPWWCWRWCA
jgi:hypothetical protein